MLGEEFVGLYMERVGFLVPDDLIDPDNMATGLAAVERAPEVDEEHGVAGDRRHVDGTAEGDREAGLEVKAIEGVDDLKIVAVGGTHRAVGERQVDPQPGIVAGVSYREQVAGEGASCWSLQIEEGLDARGEHARRRQQEDKKRKEEHPATTKSLSECLPQKCRGRRRNRLRRCIRTPSLLGTLCAVHLVPDAINPHLVAQPPRLSQG